MGKIQKIMKNEIDSIKGMNKSLDLLKNGNFTEALNNFSELLKSNYSDSTIDSGIKCCKYWIPRVSKFEFMKDDSFKGKFIIDEWNKFESFISSLKNMQEKVVSNTMFHIFNLALQAFKKDLNENRIIDFETTLLIGITYKKIGDYRSSISYFQDFLMNDSHNSNAMALLADCYALIDEEKKSKILFREAFFNDALGIDINLLESHIINTITAKIEEFKIKKEDFTHWIPVFGRVYGIFNIYREILPVEYGKLKQEIFYLENEQNKLGDEPFYIPRLLNCYLWLYDYHTLKNVKNSLEEVEEKIKNISPDLYDILKSNS